MTNTTSNHELGARIEQLVREHMAASRQAAQEAVQRAFGSAKVRGPARERQVRASASASAKRRTPSEMAALAERLYLAMCAKPGETMTVLIADVGATASELSRPVAMLKRTGRVRTAGARNHMRYFPMAHDTSASA